MVARSIVCAGGRTTGVSGPFFAMDVPAFAARAKRRFHYGFNILAEDARRFPPHYWASAEDSINAARAPDQFLITWAKEETGGHGPPATFTPEYLSSSVLLSPV
jgi:hypothetical protein